MWTRLIPFKNWKAKRANAKDFGNNTMTVRAPENFKEKGGKPQIQKERR